MTMALQVLALPDGHAWSDLSTFVNRAKRVDPDGAARLVGHGEILAVYASPVHGGGGPTVIGLRAMRLAERSTIDVTVPLAALCDRLAHQPGPKLSVPPNDAPGVVWAGVLPPRDGWTPVGVVDPVRVIDRAAAGIAEVTAGAPAGSGAAAVAALRGKVWGGPLSRELPQVPAGVAFVADSLGFVAPTDTALLGVYRNGPWWRASSPRGHIMARQPSLS